ncbi:hypothetical protein [Parerythrobacter lacustris]|uniref:Argininosuccinate lyase n=1 Tax=Parerythrobacter lacustris TaxID=2969984 RepID=A0ABT1XSR6_9SPHN|nr:hypothetical protein [Parerythrobacter lacustris]MCR2834708.1 hypothetical protein [Parerythrobacter lacustris]
MTRKLAVLPITLLLSACGWFDQAPESEEAAGVQGEVLEGSISDEMIPADELRSQSPRAAPEPGESGAAGSDPSTAEEGDDRGAASIEEPAEPAEPSEPAEE